MTAHSSVSKKSSPVTKHAAERIHPRSNEKIPIIPKNLSYTEGSGTWVIPANCGARVSRTISAAVAAGKVLVFSACWTGASA